MPGLAAAPHDDGGAGHGGHHNAVLIAAVGLLVLLVAMAIIAATTLTGPDSASSAEQARAAKLRKLPVYWKVHTGDSYLSIAQQTGLTVDELERFNPYINPAAIQPGQRIKLRLRVPPGKPKPPGPRFYTVRTGDTFASIAKKTDHSMVFLLEINRKVNPSSLQPGQRVRLRK